MLLGKLGNTDYIEFWGNRNDGKPDKYLYIDSTYQLNNRLSLQSDTAAFYLTVNSNPTTTNPNLRFIDSANNIPTTTPTPVPYFIYTQNIDFQQAINYGYAQVVSPEYLYSSSYDLGEFWASQQIQSGSPLSIPLDNLYASSNGPAAALQGAFVATLYGSRTVQVNFNNDNTNVVSGSLNQMTPGVFANTNIPLTTLTGSPSNLIISITSQGSPDYVVCNYLQLKYPRLFNFGNQSNFSFTLPANAQGSYLQITNFNAGNTTPVLYDSTNHLRYKANTNLAGLLQFQLPPSTTSTDFILVSEDATVNSITTISSFQQRNFIDYSQQTNQGDYLIISNKILGLTNGGAVDNYRAYRSTTGFNSKIYDIDDLEDQFGYGIKKYPLSIKNFIRYASAVFAKKPTNVILMGNGVTYDQYRNNQSSPVADKLNLVPTWGWPASDALLVSADLNPNPSIGFGRVSAVTQAEVTTYLNKVKEYEGHFNDPNTIAARSWMKNIIHVAGADDAGLSDVLIGYLKGYQSIISQPLFGANVYNFNKSTTGPVSSVYDAQLTSLINNGVSLITYFGHGSSGVIDYANLNDPAAFSNTGKYPMFFTNGCSVGSFYDFDTTKFSVLNYLSEKYLFAKGLGAIGVIGNSSFGLTSDLDTYSKGFYNSLDGNGYYSTIATNMHAGTARLKSTYGFGDYFSRIHAEETVLEGDPAIKVYASAQPDYVVEQQNVVINPSILSVSNTSFTVKAYLYNIGKATTDSFVNVLIQRVFPDGSTTNLFNQKIPNFAYQDSVILTIPIIGTRDKGTNQIRVSINNDQAINEVTFANNSITTSFTIFDNGIMPVYPYNYAIVNKKNIQLVASTANPLSAMNTYTMDLDTTALFNSSFKITKTVSSTGGAVAFDPGITFIDSTVYYWRVAQVPTSGAYIYNSSSFVYLSNSSTGFNQSHLYQHLQSTMSRMYLDSSSRRWNYLPTANNIQIRSAVFTPSNPNTTEDADYATLINNIIGPWSACVGHSLIFNIYDPVTLLPLYNQAVPSAKATDSAGGFMGSAVFCRKERRQWNFEFQLFDTSGRRPARDFLNWIPKGYIVTARLNYDDPTPFANVWAGDSIYYGANNTLYSALKSYGFSAIDSFNQPRTFAFIFQKNTSSFTPQWLFSEGTSDPISLKTNLITPDTLGYVTSPLFGPAASWRQLKWRGSSLETTPKDAVNIYVVGVDSSGNKTQLMTLNNNIQDIDISSINASQYPYIQLMMRNADSINLIPYQLRYWRLLAGLVPEGAIAPNITYLFTDTATKKTNPIDSFQVGEIINTAIAFKNISDTSFRDSIAVQFQIVDNNNNTTVIPVSKLKKLVSGDTAVVYANINTANFVGNNTLYINVNPNNSQPEQYHFNNFLYKSFYVAGYNTNPVMDVTFDGVHILNNDIISSKPSIQIKLVDNGKYLLLNDTSAISVQLLFPDGTTHSYSYSSDTLRFTPASPNSPSNSALTLFTPLLGEDGTYELIVTGKNRNGSQAGAQQYTVQFQVINKPMISNVFNYPNPFTTSTAFVFTLTGSEVPQNLKIEIMTISGKIVKEITREQLGNLHIGNNITTYKWDGTDMFGAKLGNGVYLYRVVTKLNGNSIDKFNVNQGGPNTDMFFKGGYGKMYLMR